jgi:hypothetical protein
LSCFTSESPLGLAKKRISIAAFPLGPSCCSYQCVLLFDRPTTHGACCAAACLLGLRCPEEPRLTLYCITRNTRNARTLSDFPSLPLAPPSILSQQPRTDPEGPELTASKCRINISHVVSRQSRLLPASACEHHGISSTHRGYWRSYSSTSLAGCFDSQDAPIALKTLRHRDLWSGVRRLSLSCLYSVFTPFQHVLGYAN